MPSTPMRVSYYDGQPLRLSDFVDEQNYHIVRRRQHNVTGHTWGVVSGLDVVQDGDKLYVQAGYAVDGFGRELVLRQRLEATIPERTAPRYVNNVWLCYTRKSENVGSPASPQCQRWEEVPVVYVTDGATGTPDCPPDVTDCDKRFDPAAQDAPEDGWWPVFVAQVTTTAPPKKVSVDQGKRRYAGVRAAVVAHPESGTWLELGSEDKPLFAVHESPNAPVVSVEPEKVTIKGDLTTARHLEVAGGPLAFDSPLVDDAPRPWCFYRRKNGGNEDLRLELPAGGAFVVGAWSEDEKKVLPCLTVSADGAVTVHGALVVRGALDGYAGGGNLTDDGNLPTAIAAALAADNEVREKTAAYLKDNYPDVARDLITALGGNT